MVSPSENGIITLDLLFESIKLVNYKTCYKEFHMHFSRPINLLKTSTESMVSLSSQSNDVWVRAPGDTER